MSAFNLKLKEQREAKKLSIPFIASKLGIAETVIETLESSNLTDEIYPINAKISYIKRYAELLEISTKEINNAINEIHTAHQKKIRKANLTWFDYLNRLVILALIAWLVYLVYGLYISSLSAGSNTQSEEIIIHTQQLPQYESITTEQASPQNEKMDYIQSEWIPKSNTEEVISKENIQDKAQEQLQNQ